MASKRFPFSGSVSQVEAAVGKAINNNIVSVNLPTGAATEATLDAIRVAMQFGTDGTGVTQPTGGSGLRGWISGIYSALSGALTNSTGLFARLTDGTRNATIKAASVAPIAADTALVTVLSPNQTAIPIDSELPAAILLADNLTLPTAPIVGSANLLFDGTKLNLRRSGAQPPSQSAAVVLSQSVVQTQIAAIATINIDLLTGSINGWFDASLYKSCSIQIVAAAGITAGFISFEQTNDITSTAVAGNVWAVEEDTSLTPTPIVAPFNIVAGTLRMFRAPITARYVRVRVSTAFAGGTVQAVGVFSQAPYTRMVQTIHQSNSNNLNTQVLNAVNVQPTTVTLSNDVNPSPITVTATAGIFTPNFGTTSEFILAVTNITGTNATMLVQVEESLDAGTTWQFVYEFPLISNNTALSNNGIGTYRSGLFATAGNRYRYAQTIGGTTPSFTRSITRTQSHVDVPTSRGLKFIRSTAIESTRQFKVGRGVAYNVQVMATAAGYLMLFDLASPPVNGAVTPLMPPIEVTANKLTVVGFDADVPLRFDNGLIAVLSSTPMFTLTAISNGFFGGQIV